MGIMFSGDEWEAEPSEAELAAREKANARPDPPIHRKRPETWLLVRRRGTETVAAVRVDVPAGRLPRRACAERMETIRTTEAEYNTLGFFDGCTFYEGSSSTLARSGEPLGEDDLDLDIVCRWCGGELAEGVSLVGARRCLVCGKGTRPEDCGCPGELACGGACALPPWHPPPCVCGCGEDCPATTAAPADREALPGPATPSGGPLSEDPTGR